MTHHPLEPDYSTYLTRAEVSLRSVYQLILDGKQGASALAAIETMRLILDFMELIVRKNTKGEL